MEAPLRNQMDCIDFGGLINGNGNTNTKTIMGLFQSKNGRQKGTVQKSNGLLISEVSSMGMKMPILRL